VSPKALAIGLLGLFGAVIIGGIVVFEQEKAKSRRFG
jgi:hypothetical protein